MNVPERDRFQVITEHARNRLIYNASYLGVERSDGIVLVQVFLSKGRTTQQKQAFYAGVARRMASAMDRFRDAAEWGEWSVIAMYL